MSRSARPPAESAADLLDAAFHTVLAAPDDSVEFAVDSAASRLAEPADRWDAVSRAVLALGERVVAGCWARGWQPADIARLTARELTERHQHITTDLIAAQGRRPAEGPRGPRWDAQLRDLGATTPWWTDDSAYLTGIAAREGGLPRFGVAGHLLDVLRLLARLPGITPLHAETAPAPDPSGEPRMLTRIRALLAKAESTEFPDEAEAFTAKAQELMARHSIDEALVAQTRPGDGPGACRIGVDSPYDAQKALLLDAVADANRCQSVWSREFGFSTVIGFDADLDAVELLYTSLLVQATAAMNHAGSRGRSRTRAFRQSFLTAYAGRIRERLLAAAERAEREAATAQGDDRLLPVLAARGVAVRDTTERLFPQLKTHRVRIRDEEGWVHGKAAADRADLHGRRKVTRR